MLQISRGTLREPLRQLEQEGLISAGARGRMSVRHLNVKEIRDIFAVRGVLESLAARTLSDMPDKDAALAELRVAVDNMDKAAKSSLEDRIESDLEFHRTLCRLSGSETLLHSWESLEGSIRMSIMFAGLERATRNMSVGRHHDIGRHRDRQRCESTEDHHRSHGRRSRKPGGVALSKYSIRLYY